MVTKYQIMISCQKSLVIPWSLIGQETLTSIYLILYKLIELEKQLQDPTMQMLMANGLINPAALCGLDAETAKLLGIAPAPTPSKTAQVLFSTNSPFIYFSSRPIV